MILDNQGLICAQHRHNHEPHHVYGHSRLLYDESQKLSWVYVTIPKNASSYVKAAFKSGYWYNCERNQFWNPETNQADERWQWFQHKVQAKTVLDSPKKFVVVLRDIVDRWTTGIAQIVGPDEHLACEFEHWVRNPRCYNDNHLEPQVSFIHGLDPNSITWLWADKNLTINLTRWAIHNRLTNHLNLQPPVPEDKFNKTVFKSADVQRFVYGLRDYVTQDPSRVRRIIDAYPQDHDLIRSVEFFHG